MGEENFIIKMEAIMMGSGRGTKCMVGASFIMREDS